jgi:hypothetical protein
MEVDRPEGYIANNGYVDHLIPTGDGTLVWVKWVKLRDDGSTKLLAGRSRDEEPYVVSLYTSPDYTSSEPVELLPAWFTYLINGPAAEYHVFRDAVGRLDKWEYLAEVERICRYAERRCEILCHRQIFGRETLSDLTTKSNAIEMKRGLQVLCGAYSCDSVAL